MGYIVLPAQLNRVNELSVNCESIELLWHPGFIQLTVWPGPKLYKIDESGDYEKKDRNSD